MRRPLTLPDLTLNGTSLPVVGDCKLLGVHISSDLKWDLHIQKIIAKANKCIFILIMARKFRFSIPTLITLYQWYVRTTLEYAAPVWHPGLTEHQHTMLERVQRRCLRIILGREYEGYEDALARLQFTTLRSRREMLTLRLGKSMLRSADHRSLLPPSRGAAHGRNLRHRHLLRPVWCRNERYKKTFVPYVTKLLNNNM